MTTRNALVPTYEDLARAGAAIERTIDSARCTRLLSVVEALSGVTTRLSFSLDERNRVKVAGIATAKVKMACQLCTLPVALELHAEVDGTLALSEDEAMALRAEDGLTSIVVSGPELNELELVEDELLLRLPSRVCTDTECAQRPAMAYGPAPDEAAQRDAQGAGAFAVLAGLRGRADSSDESAT